MRLAGGALLALAAYAAAAAAMPRPAAVSSPVTADAGSPEARLLTEVNRQRRRRGLAPLDRDPALAAAAGGHSAAMAERRFFDHCDLDTGVTAAERAVVAGYDWGAVGEALAAGPGDPAEVVEEWLASPGHREIVLGAEFADAGVGHTRVGTALRLDSDGDCAADGPLAGPFDHLWTLLVGRRDLQDTQDIQRPDGGEVSTDNG